MRFFSVRSKLFGEAFSFVYCDSIPDAWDAARRYKIHGSVYLTFPWIYGIMFPLIRISRRSDGRDFRGDDLLEVCAWPQFWPSTGSDYVETVLLRAPESTDFRLKSIKKMRKSRKKSVSFCLGPRCRRFKSCHSDQNCRFDCFLRSNRRKLNMSPEAVYRSTVMPD